MKYQKISTTININNWVKFFSLYQNFEIHFLSFFFFFLQLQHISISTSHIQVVNRQM